MHVVCVDMFVCVFVYLCVHVFVFVCAHACMRAHGGQKSMLDVFPNRLLSYVLRQALIELSD